MPHIFAFYMYVPRYSFFLLKSKTIITIITKITRPALRTVHIPAATEQDPHGITLSHRTWCGSREGTN